LRFDQFSGSGQMVQQFMVGECTPPLKDMVWYTQVLGPFKSTGGHWWQFGWNDLNHLEQYREVYVDAHISGPVFANRTFMILFLRIGLSLNDLPCTITICICKLGAMRLWSCTMQSSFAIGRCVKERDECVPKVEIFLLSTMRIGNFLPRVVKMDLAVNMVVIRSPQGARH
jgi:hypothetical protein